MQYKAVITGDIVDSSRSISHRGLLLETLVATCESFLSYKAVYELFRGDSFQILLDNPEYAARLAILIRCALISATPPGQKTKWDARISIGIGTVEYYSEKITTSDGEAFRFSGQVLDCMKKERLKVTTPWDDFNDAIAVCTSFLDYTISSWTKQQAELIYCYLENEKHKKETADELCISPQNLSQRLKKAQADNVVAYTEYFYKSIKTLISI